MKQSKYRKFLSRFYYLEIVFEIFDWFFFLFFHFYLQNEIRIKVYNTATIN